MNQFESVYEGDQRVGIYEDEEDTEAKFEAWLRAVEDWGEEDEEDDDYEDEGSLPEEEGEEEGEEEEEEESMDMDPSYEEVSDGMVHFI